MPHYHVRTKRGSIELDTHDLGEATALWRRLPNGASVMEYTDRGWVKIDPLKEASNMHKNARGIYHGTAASEDDYVIHKQGGTYHPSSAKYYVDRIGRGGTHVTIGTTRGFPSVAEAIQGIRKDAHTRGIKAGVIFEQRGDELAQIGHTDSRHEANGSEESLSFDLKDYGAQMMQWHSSGGDPIYAVGSFAYSGKIHPDRQAIRDAVSGLQRIEQREVSASDKRDLQTLIEMTQALLNPGKRVRSFGLHADPEILQQFVQDAAESMEIKNWKDAEVTPEVIGVATQYDDALEIALEEVVERFPPENGADATDLWNANAPYLVLMTLRGEGVGIWDGDWDDFYRNTKPVEEFLYKKLGRFADSSGAGSLNEAFMNAACETTGGCEDYSPNTSREPNWVKQRAVRGRERAEPDVQAARELSLYIENEYDLVGAPNSQGKAIEKNLLKKIKNGTFDLALSEKAWMYLMETGAKKYAKEFADPKEWAQIFNKPTRELVAHEFAVTFYEEYKNGNR